VYYRDRTQVRLTRQAIFPRTRFEVALLMVEIATSQCFARDYHNPTRERGTQEGTRRERRKPIPNLRFGL